MESPIALCILGEKADRQDISAAEIRAFTGNFYFGPIFYVSAFVVAFMSGIASVLLILAVAIFYDAWTRSTKSPETPKLRRALL